MRHVRRSLVVAAVLMWGGPVLAADPPPPAREAGLNRGLLAHWPLAGDTRDHSGHGRHAQVRGAVKLQVSGPAGTPNTAAEFNGRDAWLEVPADHAPQLGAADFTVAAWVQTDETDDDAPGDLVSQYDPARRRGFHVGLNTNAVTTSQGGPASLWPGRAATRGCAFDDQRQTLAPNSGAASTTRLPISATPGSL